MKKGDLIRFADDGTWPDTAAGRIGLVTAVRQATEGMWQWHKFYFDAIVDGQLRVGYGYSQDWEGEDSPVVVINEAG